MSVTAEDDADVGWTPCEIAQREHISIYDVLCRQLGETRDDGDDTASVTVGGGGGGFGAKIAAPFASAADASPPAAAVSALHLLMHADERIPTGCATIDALLSGGLERGKIVECHGDIGVGKTTLALQVAAVVASGVAAPSTSSSNTPHAAQTVLFIDSEGSFVPSRCEEIIRALQREAAVDAHTAAKQAESGGAAAAAAAATAACDAAMRRVLVQRCHSHSELLCALFALRNNVRRANVSTVIVDSVSAVLRHGSQHGGQHPAARSHTYARVFNLLAQLASECHVAMLVCNQLTTKVLGGDVGEGAGGGVAAAAVAGAATRTVMVPALGELWGHFCHTRLRLKNYTLSISAAAAAAAGVDRDGDGGGGGDVGGAGGYDDDDADAVMSSPSANAASALMRSTSALPPRLRFVRTATLVKSPNQAESSVSFAITASGLR